VLRRLLLLLLILLATGAALLAADWWIGVPAGERATYVGRQQCIRCHEKEAGLWAGSDHDRAMDHATAETVLGDFDDCEFTHVAFEDLGKLSDDHLRIVLQKTKDLPWATALKDAKAELSARILGSMPEADAAKTSGAIDDAETVRPADVAEAQDRITRAICRLEEAGEVSTEFALTSRFFRRGEKFFVHSDGADGRMQDFQVKYVFGVQPLQQYLIELPDGRVQCLPIAWDTVGKRWYHLYPAEPIPAGDVLHWTGALQNWNYMCAECHSTDLQKNYDLKTDTYNTTFKEIDVSCETCHGPGSLHVELADSIGLFKWDRRIGYGLPNLKSQDSHVEIETCAPCHARRRAVYPGFKAGDKLLDHYAPQLLDSNLYYADGQILEEDYVYGSFIQSKMYAQGVRCTDCHDPHSARVKTAKPDDPWGAPIDNRLCTGCHIGTHPAGKYDTPAHHHHPDSSKPGTRCVECHMAETKYMVVDPRRDHSMRNPRPDLSIWLDIPNACNTPGCHDDKSAQWSEDYLLQWYGKRKGPTHFAYAIDAGRRRDPKGETALEALTRRKDASAMVRATAILLLANYPTATGRTAALRALDDPEAIVRAAAVQCLQDLRDPELTKRLGPMLEDPLRTVRADAVRILSAAPEIESSERFGAAFQAALAEYMVGQEALADQPGSHLNMAVVLGNLGQLDRAQQKYKTALRLDPEFIPARVNLAMLLDQQRQQLLSRNRPKEAERMKQAVIQEFQKAIELEPEMAELHYSLGLLLAENTEDKEQLEEAATKLAEAARLSPQNPRMHYNYALALQHLDRRDEAEGPLKTACSLAPGEPDYLYALTILYTQQERWPEAQRCAEELVHRWPNVREMHELAAGVARQAAQAKNRERAIEKDAPQIPNPKS